MAFTAALGEVGARAYGMLHQLQMNIKLTAFLVTVATQSLLHAVTIQYVADLNGPSEVPPNASPGTGSAEVDYDSVAHTLRVQVSFSGLLGTTIASHIHAPTSGPFTGTATVATQTPTFIGFPLGVTAGTYDHTFDMTQPSFYNAPFLAANGGDVAAAEAALIGDINTGLAYLNIHTSVVPGGEIRGFLTAAPDGGSTLSMLGLALGAGLAFRRGRRGVI